MTTAYGAQTQFFRGDCCCLELALSSLNIQTLLLRYALILRLHMIAAYRTSWLIMQEVYWFMIRYVTSSHKGMLQIRIDLQLQMTVASGQPKLIVHMPYLISSRFHVKCHENVASGVVYRKIGSSSEFQFAKDILNRLTP